MEQYSSNEIEITIPPESLEIWDTRHVLVTHDEVYFYANDDKSFFWLENNESIIKKKGQGLLIMADAIRLGLDQRAQVIIKPEQANGYWKSVFCFDQSTNYNTYALDALVCFKMILYPKVEPKFKFKDGWFIRDHQKIMQPMLFLIKMKMIAKILKKRSMRNSQKLDYKRKKGNEK
ncbi:17997_t:CDS:2, partial [Gigaspora rosea]